jgi:hypothetical protein
VEPEERQVVVEPARRQRRSRPSAGILLLRYGLPAALLLAGVVSLFVVDASAKLDALAMFTGAGLSVLLLNVLFRWGVKGDEERVREEDAREYFSEHSEWTEEEERPAGRKWSLPAGAVMPADEQENSAADDRR